MKTVLLEDVKIKNFLNLNKFSIEKTKQKIDMYYTIRSITPELFEVSNPKLEVTKNLFNNSWVGILTKNEKWKGGIFKILVHISKTTEWCPPSLFFKTEKNEYFECFGIL